MRLRLFCIVCAIVVALPLLAGCSRGEAGITVAGSTSVQPFAELLAEEFMREHPGAAINVQGGGSSAGIQAALTGAAAIGMSSRDLKADEARRLRPVTIALDAIALVVHPSNPVTGLSVEETRRLFAGEATNWREFGGVDKEIHVVTREEGSGTRGAFQELVMGKADISPGAIVQDSNGAVRQVVADDPYSIGYVSLGLVNTQVKALRTDGVVPSNDNVKAGTYQLVRPFLYVLNGEPSAEASAFIDYTLSPEGQQLLASEGLVPAQ
jgi:phosphate transport system substrate-binding protein